MQFYYDDSEFGRVAVTMRRGMMRITFRRKDGALLASVPYLTTPRDLASAIDRNRERLRRLPDVNGGVRFAVGQVIECFGCTITLAEQSLFKQRISIKYTDGKTAATLGLPQGLDLNAPPARQWVSRAIDAALKAMAPGILLPYAREVSRQIGAVPKSIEVGRGMTKLGHCTRDGRIMLSHSILLLGERLVRHIVCHELAHLSHFDHSPAFHALCNAYDGGHEAQLERELKAFKWPVVR